MNRTLTKLLVVTALAVLIALPTVASAEATWPSKVVVATPASGTSIHMVAVGMGKAIEKYTPIKHWIVQPMGGPTVWAPMMKKKAVNFSLHSGPDTINVLLGKGKYAKQGPMPFIRTVLPGHEYGFMFHTVEGSGIKSIADLKGKVVYSKLPGNPMFQTMLEAQLGSAGLKEKDLKASLTMPNVREGARDLIEGRVQAFLYPIVPSAVMQINQAKGECLFVNLTKEQAESVAKQLPGYYPKVIPAGMKKFANKSEIKWAICYRSAMYTRADTPEEEVYGIVKALMDHKDAWTDSHPQAKFWGPLYDAAPPYHPGTIRYFKEKGLWTKEAQAFQDRILGELKKKAK